MKELLYTKPEIQVAELPQEELLQIVSSEGMKGGAAGSGGGRSRQFEYIDDDPFE